MVQVEKYRSFPFKFQLLHTLSPKSRIYSVYQESLGLIYTKSLHNGPLYSYHVLTAKVGARCVLPLLNTASLALRWVYIPFPHPD